ncbi:DUF5999 family protein [Streptomyces noursei]|uniref:DUF5999 family protein n=1 Tax=Streptomyces noursei TaxID=1971 RepID=UPI0035E3D370
MELGLRPRKRLVGEVVLHPRHTPGSQSLGSPARGDRRGDGTVMKVQRRALLCNGVLLLVEDAGELLPDGQVIAPHRPGSLVSAAA